MAVVVDETALVVIVNVAEVEPAGTVTVPGTVALVELEFKVTLAPPGPAAPFSVTVPVEGLPPVTDVGETVKLSSVAGLMVSVPVFVDPPCVPWMVAVVTEETALVVTVKVAEVAPADTVTDAGTVALVVLLESDTVVPPGPAAPFSVAVPTAVAPPVTVDGETLMLKSVAASIVNVACCCLPFSVPVIVAGVLAETAVVVTVKVAEVAPGNTRTDGGTVAFVLLDDRPTVMPPGPAGPVSVAVPVDGFPPITVVGERLILLRVAASIVSVAICVAEASFAVIVALTLLETAVVVIVNVPLVAPAATVTEPGTTAFELPEDRLTVEPPGPAAPLSVTVPVDEVPPITVAGETLTL